MEPLEDRRLLASWSGTLTENTLWDSTEVQEITGDLTVPSGVTLTIQAGTVVKLHNSGVDLFVNGQLDAAGTVASPIIFTSLRDDVGGDTNGDGGGSSPAAGDWSRIQVNGSATISHAEIKFGGHFVGTMLEANSGSLNLSNSILSHSANDGFRAKSANPVLTGIQFLNNGDAAASMDLGSNPTFSGVTLVGNQINALQVDSGPLTTNLVWDDPDIVYWLNDDISVPVGMTLQIGQGQIVKPSHSGAEIIVDGTFQVTGTGAAPVIFTSSADDSRGGDTNGDAEASTPAPGNWGRIYLRDDSSGNTIEFMEAHYGGHFVGHALVAAETDLSISNSTFASSASDGVRLIGTDATMTNNVFHNNADAAISMDLNSNPAISGVTLSGNGINGLQVDSGTVGKNLVWNDADIVYRLNDDIAVPVGLSLQIDAGQIVKPAHAGVELFVDGSLQVTGTASNPVIFTSVADDSRGGDTNGDADASLPAPGNWGRINLRDDSSGNTIEYLESYFGGHFVGNSFVASNTDLTISNSKFDSSASDGVRLNGTDAVLTANSFLNNMDAAVSMDLNSNPTLSDVTLTNNGINGLQVDGGTLSKSLVWNDPDIVYRLNDDITVPVGVSLRVDAGQIVKPAHSGVELFVDGTFEVTGTAAAPVVFTSVADDSQGGDTNSDAAASAPAPGNWGRIFLRDESSGNTVDYLESHYGGHFVGHSFVAVDTDLTISNSTFTSSASDGVRLIGTDAIMTDNIFNDNVDAAISMDLHSNPAISGVSLSGNGINGLQVDSGTLGKSLVWNDPDIVYRLDDDITVPAGLSLQIGAGQIVKPAHNGVEIHVDGTLQVTGTDTAPVIFTSVADDSRGGDTNGDQDASAPARGDWGRIHLRDESSGNTIDYLESYYGGHFVRDSFRATNTDLMISNSTFANSASDGVRLNGTDALLTDNTFMNNADAAISMDLNSNPAISGVTLSDNGINGLQVDTGTLGKSLVWNDPDIVYRLDNDITVPTGLSLQIDAGQIVKPAHNGVEIHVDGTFQVTGTDTAPAIFTSVADDSRGGDTNGDQDASGPARGDWGRIHLRDASSGNTIDYLESYYGGHFVGDSFLASDTDLAIANSTFASSASDGVRLIGTDAVLTDNTFTNNVDAAISMDLNSNPAISGVSLSGNGINAVQVYAGTLQKDLVWNDPDIVYWLTNDVVVPAGMTLQVDAGQIVKPAHNGAEIIVDGSFQVTGTTTHPVVFTSFADDSRGGDSNGDGNASVPAPGHWGTVLLRTGSTNSTLDYAQFLFGGHFVGAALIADDAPVSILGSWFRQSPSHAIIARGDAFLEVSNSTLTDNVDTGIVASSGAYLNSFDNTFENNSRGILVSGATADISGNRMRNNRTSGISVLSGSTVSATNNAIEGHPTGVTVTSTDVILANNTVVHNDTGISAGNSSQLAAINNIVAYQAVAGISAAASAHLDLRHNDVFNPTASLGNFNGLPDPEGAAGNITLNPRFYGRGQTGDYRLWQGSPAIDAALSSDVGLSFRAPTTDIQGNPRFDDPGVEPNRGAGAFDYYDMGAFERQQDSEPDADLQIHLTTAPTQAIVGETLSLSWIVTNNGPNIAYGPWEDIVGLRFNDPTALAPPVLLEVEHVSNLGIGESYRVDAQVKLPGLEPGEYRWVVQTDAYEHVFEAQLEENNRVESAPLAIDMTELELGIPLDTAFIGDGDQHWYKLPTQLGSNVQLTLDREGMAGRTELFVAQDYVPDPLDFDNATGAFGGPDAVLRAAATPAGYLYLLAEASSLGAESGAYQIVAESFDITLRGVSPTIGGNTGTVTVTIEGQGIPRDATAKIISPNGTELVALGNHWLNPTQLVATFDMQGVSAGDADVVLVANSVEQKLEDAFRIDDGGAADFWVRVIGPGFVRIDRPAEYRVTWGNRGLVDAPAHMLKLSGSNIVDLFLDRGGEALPAGYTFLTMDEFAPIPVVPAGFESSLTFYATTSDFGNFDINAEFVPFDDPSLAGFPIDWSSILQSSRPDEIDVDTWNILTAQLDFEMGDNWLTFLDAAVVDTLSALHRPASTSGVPSTSYSLRPALLAAINRAEASLGWQGNGNSAGFEAASERPGQVRSVVIGAHNYTSKLFGGQGSVPGVDRDIRAVLNWLQTQGEVPKDRINYITDANRCKPSSFNRCEPLGNVDQVKSGDAKAAIANLAQESGPEDTAFFYYSGHSGTAEDGTFGALEFEDDAYGYDQILKDLNKSQAGRIVVVLDSCDSGNMIDELQKLVQSGDITQAQADRFSITTATARGKQQESQSRASGGFFTKVLIRELSNPDNDANKDGVVSIHEAFAKLPADISSPFWWEQRPSLSGQDAAVQDPTGASKHGMENGLGGQSPNGTGKTTKGGRSGAGRDPNEKYNSGVGDEAWIAPDDAITFTIRFENIASPDIPAEFILPAQTVVVTDQLPSGLDWTTFQLGNIGFGATNVNVPPGQQEFQTTTVTDSDPNPVSIRSELNPDTGIVTWHLRSFDAATKDYPADPLAGFLPVNDETGRGEGYVTFKIRPLDALADGAQISNTASIVFDTNDPIVTHTVLNTIDDSNPTSAVDALPVSVPMQFTVSWSGTDTNGAGVASYDIYVSKDSGPFTVWQNDIFTTSATLTGEPGHTYSFYSLATDQVGHREIKVPSNEATTTVITVPFWQNPAKRHDVNNDDFVTPIDALIIINILNDPHGLASGPLPTDGSIVPPPYIDISGDDFVSPLDALMAINYINQNPDGEGEPAFAKLHESSDWQLLAAPPIDPAENLQRSLFQKAVDQDRSSQEDFVRETTRLRPSTRRDPTGGPLDSRLAWLESMSDAGERFGEASPAEHCELVDQAFDDLDIDFMSG